MRDIADFHTCLQVQWSQHLQDLNNSPRLTVDHISRLKAVIGKQAVIHHADHQNQNARTFCPQLYFPHGRTPNCFPSWSSHQLKP